MEKSVRPFAGTTLLDIKIKQLKKVGYFDEIVVNTNSEIAIEIAQKHSVSYYKRETKLIPSQPTASDFFCMLADSVSTDIFVYAAITSPFLRIETIKKCIDHFLREKNCDSVASVNPVKKHLWLDGKPINFNHNDQPNSRDLPDIYAVNFGIAVIQKNLLLKHRNIIGINPKLIPLYDMEGINVESEIEFSFAEYLYKTMEI